MTLMMEPSDYSSALVLVCVLPTERDLEIARLLGWYRIPLRTAPKIVDVDLLAFYQTAAFGVQHRWRIEHYAEVKGHELTARAELLKDEPQHSRAHEEYYKIQIGPLTQLPAPIEAEEWKRITFLYTTGDRLMHARTIKDLTPRNEEREVIWRSLRERALKGGLYNPDQAEKLAFDKTIFALLSGMDPINAHDGSDQNESWDGYNDNIN
jgi:hypothetical protein